MLSNVDPSHLGVRDTLLLSKKGKGLGLKPGTRILWPYSQNYFPHWDVVLCLITRAGVPIVSVPFSGNSVCVLHKYLSLSLLPFPPEMIRSDTCSSFIIIVMSTAHNFFLLPKKWALSLSLSRPFSRGKRLFVHFPREFFIAAVDSGCIHKIGRRIVSPSVFSFLWLFEYVMCPSSHCKSLSVGQYAFEM